MKSYSYTALLSLLPFVSFVLGYILMGMLYPGAILETPPLVGKPIKQAVQIISDANLNLRVIGTKVESDLPEGTIISQSPVAGSKIKQNQALFCVISERPEQPLAPECCNKSKAELERLIQQTKLPTKIFYVTSRYPKDTCFGQYPAAGKSISITDPLVVYLSRGDDTPVIWPNFVGMPIAAVQDFLTLHGINVKVNHSRLLEPNHHCSDACVVTDQRPLVGSLIMLSDPANLSVQLQVGSLRKKQY